MNDPDTGELSAADVARRTFFAALGVGTCLAVAATPSQAGALAGKVTSPLPPVGSILAFYDLDGKIPVPFGWVLCDGKVRKVDAENKFDKDDFGDSPFWGHEIPNLSELFLRGASVREYKKLARRVGDDVIRDLVTSDNQGKHSHTIGAHTHDLPSETSSITNGGPDPGNHHYKVHDNEGNADQQWNDDHHLRTERGDRGSQGQHRHILGGASLGLSSGTPDPPEEGNHIHTIKDQTFIPAYAAVKYILRIK